MVNLSQHKSCRKQPPWEHTDKHNMPSVCGVQIVAGLKWLHRLPKEHSNTVFGLFVIGFAMKEENAEMVTIDCHDNIQKQYFLTML